MRNIVWKLKGKGVWVGNLEMNILDIGIFYFLL